MYFRVQTIKVKATPSPNPPKAQSTSGGRAMSFISCSLTLSLISCSLTPHTNRKLQDPNKFTSILLTHQNPNPHNATTLLPNAPSGMIVGKY